MKDYTKFYDYYYTDEQETAEALQKYAEAPAEVVPELVDALYHLKATAQNKYNFDYFRVLYNILHDIAEKEN